MRPYGEEYFRQMAGGATKRDREGTGAASSKGAAAKPGKPKLRSANKIYPSHRSK